MNTKSLLGIACLLIIVAGVVYYVASANKAASSRGPVSASYEWKTTELEPHAAAPDTPRTGVVLHVDGKAYPIGEFDGSCFVIETSSWTLLENEKTGIICWWAGGGSEVGVFEENGKGVVKVGSLDEGTAEIQGFRGDFKTIIEL